MTGDAVAARPVSGFRVGITGHRLNKLPLESRRALGGTLVRTLSCLDEWVAQALSDEKRSRSSACPPEVWIVSPLAEGVDRMAVDAAPPEWLLHAILPMPRADYERDFRPSAESESRSLDEFRTLLGRAARVTELPALRGAVPQTGAGRDQHYAKLGTYLVSEVDLLVAVWDGQKAQGPGGTAAVVAEALRRGVAIVWIDPRQPERATNLRGFENFDLARPLLREFDRESLAPLLDAVLSGIVNRLA